jgi:hypothetical protein
LFRNSVTTRYMKPWVRKVEVQVGVERSVDCSIVIGVLLMKQTPADQRINLGFA